ncbi:MAG: cytochrome c [Ignavibacteriae bacterium]|nr:MAG: cytochrome c [Ignavibacteriota bacterium]
MFKMFKINQYIQKREILFIITKKFKDYLIYCSIIILCILQFSCESNRNKRGQDYSPRMIYSEAYETYAPNNVFADGKTAQPPVLGTIPRHMIPHQYPKTPEGQKLAGMELINPFEFNADNLSRGKVVYNIFCANCHGFDGRGDGNMFASGKYPSEPPSLITEQMLKMPDGEYYHIMTVGSAIMGPFASLIRPQDKWKIILYIKNDLSQKEINNIP